MRISTRSPGAPRGAGRYVAESLEPRLLLQGVTPAGLIPDGFEPNDTRATATALGTLGHRALADLSIVGNDDFFRFTAGSTGAVTVTVTFMHAMGDVDLQLQDAAGNVITRSTTTSNTEIAIAPVTGGQTYYVRVYGFNGQVNPRYDMVINGPNLPADRFEPNNSVATATNLGAVADRRENGLNLHAFQNDDYYRVTMATAGAARFTVSASGGNLSMYLHDASGAYTGISADSFGRTVAAGEVYYLRVAASQSSGTVSNYDLIIDGPDVPPDRFEPNDTGPTATNLGLLGDRTENGLTLHAPGNEDFFRFTAGSTGPLNVNLLFNHQLGDVDMQLQDLAANVLASSTTTGNAESISHGVTAGQTYFLRVYGFGQAISPGYNMIIDGPPVAPRVTINQRFSQPDPTYGSFISFDVEFSVGVSGFTESDVSFAGSTVGGTLVAQVAGSGRFYLVGVSGMSGAGTVVVRIPAGAATDAASIPNLASTSTDNTVFFDNVPPTLTVNQAPAQADPTNASPVLFTVVFSEPVTRFTAAAVSFAGSTVGGTLVANVSGSGVAYTVSVTGMNGVGAVVVSSPGGVAIDAAGLTSFPSTSTDNTVTFDNVTPQIIARAFTFSTPQSVRYGFSERVNGLSLTDLNLYNTTTRTSVPAGNMALSYDAATNTATLTFPGYASRVLPDGNYELSIVGEATDPVGNPLNPGAPFTFFVLAGDINRDRAVNGSDFAILAGNFGKSGMSYGQGDLNGDGSVNGSDFAMLAANFGRTVPEVQAAAAPQAGVQQPALRGAAVQSQAAQTRRGPRPRPIRPQLRR